MKRSPATLVFCFFMAGGTAVAEPLVTPAGSTRFENTEARRTATVAVEAEVQPAFAAAKIS